MSLAEFDDTRAKVAALYDQGSAVAGGTGTDVLDLSQFTSDGEKLAATGCLDPYGTQPTLTMAAMECYDQVLAMRRLGEVYALTRAAYYAAAPAELAVLKNQLAYQTKVFEAYAGYAGNEVARGD